MQVDIQGSAIANRPAVRQHVERRALFELARFGERVEMLRVRLSEQPATADKRFHCGVAVTVLDADGTRGVVLARAQDDDVFRLVDAVLARAATRASGEIARADAAHDARVGWTAIAAGASRGRS
jgi:ribosome-associated translation inhibitor RaiA